MRIVQFTKSGFPISEEVHTDDCHVHHQAGKRLTEASREPLCSASLRCSSASFWAASTASGSVTCMSSSASISGSASL